MPFDRGNPLEYPANSIDPIRRFRTNRAPTNNDFRPFRTGDEWLDTASNDWWKCCFKNATSAIWRLMAGTAGAIEQILVSHGTSPIVPNATNQVTFADGNGIWQTGTLNTLTTDMHSPFTGNFTFQNVTAATVEYLNVLNQDNDPGSYSALGLTAQPAGGDAFVLFEIASATRYFALGIDNSDSDYLKLVHNTTPSGANVIFMVNPAGSAFWNYYQNLYQSAANIGGNVLTDIQNTDNTNLASHAYLNIRSGGIAGGDSFIHLQVPGGLEYSFGIDNSDVDMIKLTAGADPSTGFVYFRRTATDAEFFGTQLENIEVTAGQESHVRASHEDNTTGTSHAIVEAVSGGAAGGDPYFHWAVTATFERSMGIDNSDNDILKITDSANPSTATTHWAMTTAGERTLPLQPSFLAYVNAIVTNVTGDGTAYVVIFNTEVFDQNGDYNNATGVFTSPVIGRYTFHVNVLSQGGDGTQTNILLYLVTSNGTYRFQQYNYTAVASGGAVGTTGSVHCDMDAGDTAQVGLVVGGGNKVIDVYGNATNRYTSFSGCLVC